MIGDAILLATALLLVQGTIYLYQLGAAAMLSPASFYDMRLVESAASVGALVVSLGLPSIALVRMGAANAAERRHLMRRMVLNGVGMSAAFGAVLSLFATSGLLPVDIASHATAIFSLSTLMAFRLLLSSSVQSQEGFRALAFSSLISATLSVAVLVLAVVFGLDEFSIWFTARIALELSSIAVLGCRSSSPRKAAQDYPSQSRSPVYAPAWLLLAAAPVGISLLARALIEHGPVLWLASVGAADVVTAQVGLLVTLIGVGIIPSRIVQGTVVPRLAREMRNGAFPRGLASILVVALLASMIFFVALVFLAGGSENWEAFLSSPTVLVGGIVILVAKVGANALGAWLLILGRWNIIFALNLGTLAFGSLIAHLFIGGTAGAAATISALLVIEVTGGVLYLVASLLARSMKP